MPTKSPRRLADPPDLDSKPRVSVVVTVYNEGEMVTECLARIVEAVRLPCEVLVVFDSMDDTSRRSPRLLRRAIRASSRR